MMSTVNKVVMPLTKNLIDAHSIASRCGRKCDVVGSYEIG